MTRGFPGFLSSCPSPFPRKSNQSIQVHFCFNASAPKKIVEPSLIFDNSCSICNLCFVHELQQTTTIFCGWGSLRSPISPNLHQIFSRLWIIKSFNCNAYSRFSNSRKVYKNLQKNILFCGCGMASLKKAVCQLLCEYTKN